MKIKHVISGISPLVCILGWNSMTINSVDAANLSFTYTLESTETISGNFDGDIADDDNTVENLRNLEAVYSGEPTVIFDTLATGNFFKIDLSEFQLTGTSSSSSGASFFAVRGDNGTEGINVFIPSMGIDGDSTIVDSRFIVQLNREQQPATTPEPGITLALSLLGSFYCWRKLKQKQVPSS